MKTRTLWTLQIQHHWYKCSNSEWNAIYRETQKTFGSHQEWLRFTNVTEETADKVQVILATLEEIKVASNINLSIESRTTPDLSYKIRGNVCSAYNSGVLSSWRQDSLSTLVKQAYKYCLITADTSISLHFQK